MAQGRVDGLDECGCLFLGRVSGGQFYQVQCHDVLLGRLCWGGRPRVVRPFWNHLRPVVEGCLIDVRSWRNESFFDSDFRHARSRGDINRHSSAHQNLHTAAEFSRGLSNPIARLSAPSCSYRKVVEGAVESRDSPHFLPLNFDVLFTQNL